MRDGFWMRLCSARRVASYLLDPIIVDALVPTYERARVASLSPSLRVVQRGASAVG